MNLEKYFKQFEQLLQKLMQDREIDEYGDGDFILSLCDFGEDESEIKRIVEEKPDLEEFYSKSRPIQIQEQDSEDPEPLVCCEELSMKTLAEYLQRYPDFNYENSVTSPQSEYVIKRFRSIAHLLKSRFADGLQIPYLEKIEDLIKEDPEKEELTEEELAKRVAIGYLSCNSNQDGFILTMNDGKTEEISMYYAMTLVFNYHYQRRIIGNYEKQNNVSSLSKLPIGYREPVRYSNKSIRNDDVDFLR